MGESSKWIPEVKTTHFRPLEIFFPKIKVKSVKNEKWPKMVKKGQKWISMVSQHCLQLFLLPEPVKRAKKAIFSLFGQFLVFFGVPPSSSNLGGRVKLKS